MVEYQEERDGETINPCNVKSTSFGVAEKNRAHEIVGIAAHAPELGPGSVEGEEIS